MRNILPLRAFALLGALLPLAVTLAVAQEKPEPNIATRAPNSTSAPELASTTPEPLLSRTFQVKNVPVDLLAWWLEPEKRPLPRQILSSLENGGKISQTGTAINPYLPISNDSAVHSPNEKPPQRLRPGNALGPQNVRLPAGLVAFVVNKKNNMLAARGTRASLDVLEKLILEVDLPLQQVDISMSIIELARADTGELDLKFPANADLPIDQFGHAAVALSSAVPRVLDDLLAKNRAKILATPRLSILSGLTGQISSTERRSSILKFDYAAPPKASAPGLFFVDTSNALSCGVEVNGDLVVLQINIEWQGTATHAVGTVGDGQTLAIRLANLDPNSKLVRIALLTPRIVRKANETTTESQTN